MENLEIVEVKKTSTDRMTVPHCHHARTTSTFAWA
ncbi:hypothetical protein JOD55_001611 [Arcanobacterium pluranimalium]|nr:hypothetical protein [Arcanobacterium pluranimalium]